MMTNVSYERFEIIEDIPVHKYICVFLKLTHD